MMRNINITQFNDADREQNQEKVQKNVVSFSYFF